VTFRGWPAEAIEFFEGLSADNSKSFWQANSAVYERSVKRPMEELLAEIEPEFGQARIFRPYRDVRFSKDKSPYKTNIAAMVGKEWYVSVSAEGLGVGGGMHTMEPGQLDRYRRAVVDDHSGEELLAIVAAVAAAGYEVVPSAPLKKAPKGFPKDHPRVELLRARGIIVWKTWPPAPWLGTAKAKARTADVLRACVPLNEWLAKYVGESTAAARPAGS
jgi:uncharacterized protein (TIGR02453 family)